MDDHRDRGVGQDRIAQQVRREPLYPLRGIHCNLAFKKASIAVLLPVEMRDPRKQFLALEVHNGRKCFPG